MRRLGLLATGVLLIFASSAFAQDTSRGEVSGGWRYYHATIGSFVFPVQVTRPINFEKGWYGDVAVNVSEKFAVVGEAAGTYQSDDFNQAAIVSTQESYNVRFHTFMGGIRVRAPQHEAIVPFGQILFGGEHDSSTDTRTITFSAPLTLPPSTSTREGKTSNAALALDGGVTMMLGFVGVRTSVGYARMFSAADSDAFRFSLGAAFRF